MGESDSISVSDIGAVAEKLDGLAGLDDADRRVLAGVFELAGRAAADQDSEVQGFGMPGAPANPMGTHGIIIVNSMPQLGMNNAFQFGFGAPGSDHMGGQPHM